MTRTDSLKRGLELGSYVLAEQVERRPSSAVWRADGPSSSKPVTLYLVALPEDETLSELALAEVERVRNAQGIPTPEILEISQVDPWLVVALDETEGEPLDAVCRRQPVEAGSFLPLARELAGALFTAHESGLIHRNLSSARVLVTPSGRPLVSGFGLGRGFSATEGETVATHVSYLSPEQIAGDRGDERSDIFSLGVVFYEALTGRLPFTGTAAEVLQRISREAPTAPQKHVPGLPAALISVLGRCLPKDPGKRYQSVDRLLEDLQKIAVPAGPAVVGRAVPAAPSSFQAAPAVDRHQTVMALRSPLSDTGYPSEFPMVRSETVPASVAVPLQFDFDAISVPGPTTEQPLPPQYAPQAYQAAAPPPRARALDVEPFDDFPAAVTLVPESTMVRHDDDSIVLPPPAEATGRGKTRETVVLIALLTPAPGDATRRAGVMQQVLSEAVYLYDGKVVDPFGPRMIAELPNVESAISAARKGINDLLSHNRKAGAEKIDARLAVHAGPVDAVARSTSGPAVEAILQAASSLPSLLPVITDAALSRAQITPEFAPRAESGGVKFYALPIPAAAAPAAPEPEPFPEASQSLRSKTSTSPSRIRASGLPAPVAAAATAAPAPPRSRLPLAAGIGGGLLLLGAAAFFLLRKEPPPPPPTPAAAVKRDPGVGDLRLITIDPFVVESSAPGAADVATGSRAGAAAMLSAFKDIAVADEASAERAIHFSAKLRDGANGLELLPSSGDGRAEAVPLAVTDSASAAAAYARWLSGQLGQQVDRLLPASPETIPDLVRAAVVFQAGSREAASDAGALLRATVRDEPSYLPLQHFALRVFEKSGDLPEATEAARMIVQLDPARVDVRKKLASWLMLSGDPAGAAREYAVVAAAMPNDGEAASALARLALSAGDQGSFFRLQSRLPRMNDGSTTLHGPDVLLAAGRVDQAAAKYYEVEDQQPGSAELALKIGRIAVLRRSLPIAQLELDKLRTLDPDYGYHVLSAFIAANAKKREEAEASLAVAQKAAGVENDPFTATAEVYAMFDEPRRVLTALEAAVERGEPTGAYILNNPLFGYLADEPRFRAIREKIEAQQAQLKATLATVK